MSQKTENFSFPSVKVWELKMKKYEDVHNNIHNCTSLISYVIVVYCARQINFFVSEWVREGLPDMHKYFADAVNLRGWWTFFFIIFLIQEKNWKWGGVKEMEKNVNAVRLFHLWVSRVDWKGMRSFGFDFSGFCWVFADFGLKFLKDLLSFNKT